MEKRLVKYFLNFQLTDLIGFGKMLGVPMVEDENGFEDFVTNIVVEFSTRSFRERRGMLKLAKEIAKNNIEFDKREKVN